MNQKTFHQYISEVFLHYLRTHNATFSAIVFVDGHSFHFSFETTEFCVNNQIYLIALYPNSTHLTQPMDVALFAPIKQKWRQAVHKWKYEHNYATMAKSHFCEVLKGVIRDAAKPEYFVSAFRACGLYPFNPNGIDYNKLISQRSTNERAKQIQADQQDHDKERNEFDITYKRVTELLGKDKENSFLKFYLMDKHGEWLNPVEDKTAYFIWREALERSHDAYILSDQDLSNENIEFDYEVQDFILSNEHSELHSTSFEHLHAIQTPRSGNTNQIEILEDRPGHIEQPKPK